MKATELRIGNLIYHYDNPLPQKVDGLDEWKMQSEYLSEYSMPDKFSPIPLTKEWLLKFGFAPIGETEYWRHPRSKMFQVDTSDNEFCHVWLELFTQSPIDYVHQLQNLFFAMTGNELTIK